MHWHGRAGCITVVRVQLVAAEAAEAPSFRVYKGGNVSLRTGFK